MVENSPADEHESSAFDENSRFKKPSIISKPTLQKNSPPTKLSIAKRKNECESAGQLSVDPTSAIYRHHRGSQSHATARTRKQNPVHGSTFNQRVSAKPSPSVQQIASHALDLIPPITIKEKNKWFEISNVCLNFHNVNATSTDKETKVITQPIIDFRNINRFLDINNVGHFCYPLLSDKNLNIRGIQSQNITTIKVIRMTKNVIRVN